MRMKGNINTRAIWLIIAIVLFVKAPVLAQQEMDYKNINVDLFHGMISIHVPIYNFESNTLDVPISLDYSPVDVKGYLIPAINPAPTTVYHSGPVGLGWNLTAGGVITRRIKGIPDESDKGNFSNNHLDFDPSNASYKGLYEPDEDEFSFNFNGLSGSFFFYRGEWKINSEKEFLIQETIIGNVLRSFTITMPDGTDYIFGGLNRFGELNGVEFADNSKTLSTAWHLTSIVTAGGEQINFDYSTPTYSNDYSSLLRINQNVTHQIQNSNGSYQHSINPATITSNEAIMSVIYLEKISSPSRSFSILFNYSVFNDREYPGPHTNESSKLDNIEIVDESSNVFKKISFEYFSRSNDELLKLKSVQESAVSNNVNTASQPPFQFEYYSNTNTITDGDAPEVLKKIVYPAGGSVVFEFEKHSLPDYSLQTRSIIDSRPDYNCSEFAYGNNNNDYSIIVLDMKFRIKKQIIKGSPDEIPIVKTYQYDEGYYQAVQRSRNAVFSHVTMKPINWQLWYELFQYTNYDFVYSDELPSPEERILIGYSSVREITSNNEDIPSATSKSSTHYCFYNYSDYHGTSPLRPGLLKSIEKQNGFEEVISSEAYEYYAPNESDWLDRWSTHSFKYTLGTESMYCFTADYQTPYSHYNLKTTTTYNNDAFMQTTYNYYPTTNNISQVEVTDYDPNAYDLIPLNTTTTTFRYLHEFNISQLGGNGLNLVDVSHWLNNFPIETLVRKNGKVISGQFIKLAALGSPVDNNALRYRKPYQIFQLAITAPIDNYVMDINNGVIDSRYKLVKTFKYDIKENLLQYQNEGESPESIVYDDDMGLPLMEIKGVGYDAVKASIDINSLNTKNIVDVNRLRKIFPNALITSYVYDPKFGVSSITAPNGTTTYREYDPFGRLKCIKDQNQNILLSKNYNYYNH